MSKAFTNEDASETPLVVPPRAPLPAGVPNYVTARGLTALRTELATLEAERQRLGGPDGGTDERERSRRLAVNAARLRELGARLASAELVDPRRQPHDEVRFGATVTLAATTADGTTATRRYTIVGVDEADPESARITFLAPLARAIIGLRVGDVATLRTARGEETLEIMDIAYETP